MTTRVGDLLGGVDKAALEQRLRRAAQAGQDRGRSIAIRDLATGARYETTVQVAPDHREKPKDGPPCCWGEGVLPVLMAVDGGHQQVTWLRCTCEAAARWAKRDYGNVPIPGRYWTASYLDVMGQLPPSRQELEDGLQRWLRGEDIPSPAPVSSFYEPEPPEREPEPATLFDAPDEGALSPTEQATMRAFADQEFTTWPG